MKHDSPVQTDTELRISHAITVVIVSYNGSSWIRSCINSVLAGQCKAHVIVVDNASSDGTPELVASEFPSVELIATNQNVGFGRGNNAGIRRALELGSRYILLLNQDAMLSPGSLSKLLGFMDEHPEFGVCSPLHCSPDETHLDTRTYRGYLAAHAADLLTDAIAGTLKPFYRIPGINAAVWFARADTFTKVGGFDPLFFMYGEDDDLLSRFSHHGIGFALLPDVLAVHLRQSPVAPRAGRLIQLRRRVGRARASLLCAVKVPGCSSIHFIKVSLAAGLIRPFADALVNGQWGDCLTTWLATAQVLFEFRDIRRHAFLTSRAGAHFLDLA